MLAGRRLRTPARPVMPDRPLLDPGDAPELWAGAEQRLGFFGATVSLAVSMLGTGIVAFPYSFALCGYVVGPIALAFIGFLGYLSYVSLIRCTAKMRVASYGGLLGAIPKVWGHYTNIALWFLLIFATTAYVLIAADTIRSTSLKGLGGESVILQNHVLFALILAVIYPTCLARSVRGLSAVSAYCSSAVLAVVVLIIWKAYCIYTDSPPLGDLGMTASTEPGSILLAVPILGSAMFGHMNISQIYAELHPKVKPLASAVALAACLGVVALYLVVGCVGYAAFGRGAKADVVAQIAASSGEDPAVVAAQGLLASFIVLKTPFLILPLRNLTVSLLAPSANAMELPLRAHAGLTLALLACVYAAAVALPDLGKVIEILGAVCAIPLSFVVPARLSWSIEVPRPATACLLLAGAGSLASVLSLTAIVLG